MFVDCMFNSYPLHNCDKVKHDIHCTTKKGFNGCLHSKLYGLSRVQFANLFAEEKRDILFKLKLPSGSGGEPVLQAQLQYTDGASLQRITKDPSGVILDRSSPAPVEETPEKDVETADLRFTTAEVSSSGVIRCTVTLSVVFDWIFCRTQCGNQYGLMI